MIKWIKNNKLFTLFFLMGALATYITLERNERNICYSKDTAYKQCPSQHR